MTQEIIEKPLNVDQEKASEAFFEFLLSKDKYMRIVGPGGVGKTFLMGYLIDRIIPEYRLAMEAIGKTPQLYEVHMTATTNKAAGVLAKSTGRPCSTIHSLLSLRVQNNWSTGEVRLVRSKKWQILRDAIIFVDEASMTPRALLQEIDQSTMNCKIIFVGDHCQLNPVKEAVSEVFTNTYRSAALTIPVRTDKPELLALNQQLRDTVEKGIWKPIQEIPGVIDWIRNEEQLATEVDNHFILQETNSRIIAYKNDTVNELNAYIREQRGKPAYFQEGDNLVSNSAFTRKAANGMSESLSIEEEVSITEMDDEIVTKIIGGLEMDFFRVTLETEFYVMENDLIPTDNAYFNECAKYFAKEKRWADHFGLIENYPELRPKDACTGHKSQGSTYDTVFLDMTDLSICRNPEEAARLFYVAVSRARNRVVMYGELSKKYGGIIPCSK